MAGLSKTAIDVDGYTLNVHSSPAPAGQGGPQFVLVHGIGASHRYFLPLARELEAAGARVHALDMPGFGDTPAPVHALGIADFAELVLRALGRVGVGPATVVGHSMGGQVAVEMARQQPSAVTGMALLGPTAEDGARTLPRQALRLIRNSPRGTVRSNLLVTFDYLRCGPRWFRATLPALLNYKTEQRIAGLPIPVLIAAGQQDPVAPQRWLNKLAHACMDAETAVVAGQPHAFMFTAPAAVARLCLHLATRASAPASPV